MKKIYEDYYRDNLFAALIAVDVAAPGALNTGDWYGEVLQELRHHGADSHKANAAPALMVEDLRNRIVNGLSNEEVLELVFKRFSPLELLAHAGTDTRVEEK